jgi:hypothetical protein
MSAPLSPKTANTTLGSLNNNNNTGSTLNTKGSVKKEGYGNLQKSTSQPKSPPATRSTSDSIPNPVADGTQTKKVSRRSSKPIINWFQRKLASSGRARRASEGHGGRPQLPSFDPPTEGPNGEIPTPRERKGTSASAVDRPKSTSAIGEKGMKDEDIPPVPSLAPHDLARINQRLKDVPEGETNGKADTYSLPRSSIATGSLSSPSVGVEADEDASMRPIAPSAPPSPSLSRSSSSYLSQSHTFRSMAASTKPTTVLSIDVGNGMAHIAEAPLTPLSDVGQNRAHGRSSSQGTQSVGFILPQASQYSPATSALPNGASIQAPLHTLHHPRDNPRPSSPPPDDASVLTLASSAFGVPGARTGMGTMFDGGRDSLSNFGGTATDSTSHFAGGDDMDAERDVGASMRALRPRRSWESEASRWSARIGGTSLGPATPMGDRSLWGTSIRTGGQDDGESASAYASDQKMRPERNNSIPRAIPRALTFDSGASMHGSTDKHCPSPLQTEFKAQQSPEERTPLEKADPDATTTVDHPTPLPEDDAKDAAKAGYFPHVARGDARPEQNRRQSNDSTMTGTDVFVSAPSTPMVPS